MKENKQGGLIAWFVYNPVAANLLMVLIVIAGIYASFSIRKQSFPTIEVDVVHVQVPYLGAAPKEVEEGVVLKLEEAVKKIEGIKSLESVAQEGLGRVMIEVQEGYDVIELMNEVKVQVDAIPSFPENTENPVVYRVKPEQAVLWVQVFGDLSERKMKDYARQIRDEIVQLPGVTTADVQGARAYEIAIEIDEQTLRKHNITLAFVAERIRQFSLDLPGGTIKTRNGDILLRAIGQAYHKADFEQISILTQADGSELLLRDIAQITDAFVETRWYSKFDQKNSIGIQVKSVGTQNDLEISRVVNEYIEEKKQSWPDEIGLSIWGDSSYYLQGRLDLMLNNMLMGALLVFLILSIFLQLRLAVWVIIGLFVSFLGALAMMPIAGVSINMISLFAFILVLGIVVDDAIIIGESVHASVEVHGPGRDIVVRGANQVAMPATFGVLTTIVAFLPMLFVSGPSSPIWSSIGMVVVLCLAFSLIESKWILPSHLTSIAKHKPPQTSQLKQSILGRIRRGVDRALQSVIDSLYLPLLARCVRFRYTTLASFIAILILAIALMASGAVRFVFFPNLPSDYVQATLTMEDGTPDARTQMAVDQLQAALYRVKAEHFPDLEEDVVAHSIAFIDGQITGMAWAELNKKYSEQINGMQVANLWREEFGEVAGVRSVSFNGSISGGAGADLEFLFRSDNIEQIAAAAKTLKDQLSEFTGVYDIDDSYSGGKDELKLALKPAATGFGLTLADIAQQVRAAFYGVEVQRIQRDDEEIRVMVRYPLQQRSSIADIDNMWLTTADGRRVPFSMVADYSLGEGYATIQRINHQRSVSVTAKVDKAIAEPGTLANEVQTKLIPKILAQYPDVKFELYGSSKDEQEALDSLKVGFLFALIAIFALMAIPLKSYSKPLIIMAVIPFGIVGAVLGHYLLGLAMSVLSMFGVIALAGVVVNDSLIFVDYVNHTIERGKGLLDAVQAAGARRFRAILLTSLTTFFGLIPIVSETSLQAKIVVPMAVSLAFGILFSTIMTLLLLPTLYVILNDIRAIFGRAEQINKQ
ncbi:efflux RND transporter permease subunit [Gayadomonas joobiniege]|uniref:efflux RND transporter permease subunit n=1 Tax=Gayadomonas joobiniege TaxID=1234606 RepID=UPI000374E4AA|nr:efflux RND transporter permease subunit [Gayadomonas joobiniege]